VRAGAEHCLLWRKINSRASAFIRNPPFHAKLTAQNLNEVEEFFMMDSFALQELRDKYNDLTERVAALRRFL
jgi:hypothetical protein